MDMEGLVTLVNHHHAEVLKCMGELQNTYRDQRDLCNQRMEKLDTRCDTLCKTVKSHDTTLTKIKTLGTIWGALVLLASQFWSYFSGRN